MTRSTMESGSSSALGKRKRDGKVTRRKGKSLPSQHSPPDSESHSDHQEAFKRYFESQFQPLDVVTPAATTAAIIPVEESGEEHAETLLDVEASQEWEGLSDHEIGGEDGEGTEDGTVTVEVVEHSNEYDLRVPPRGQQSADFKSFMGAKIPREQQTRGSRDGQVRGREDEEEDESETLNLKHDLALQRLLKESHLLDGANASRNPGEQRHRATDLRLQSLGSQASIFEQNKMPIAHRRGIQAKATARESQRRKEARENGIVLEKVSSSLSKPSKANAKRERGVDAPAVGRFSAGTLKLSRQDIASIQGPPLRRGGQKGARRGRR